MSAVGWVWQRLDEDTPKGELIAQLNLRLKKLENVFNILGQLVSGLQSLGATGAPSVNGALAWITAPAAPLTITEFKGGIPGRLLVLIADNGNTTVQHDAAKISLIGGVNYTMNDGDVLVFVCITESYWLEMPKPT